MQLKLIVLLLTVTCLQLSAKTYAQPITLSQKNAPLQRVLEAIKKQSGYKCWYEDAILKKSKPVDIDVRNMELEKVLQLVFQHQPLSYEIIGKVIAIREKEAAAPAVSLTQPATRRITGVVQDSSGNPIPGVSYVIKGTRTGGATDPQGRFSIEVPDGPVILVFSSIGFEPRSVSVGNNTVLRVTLLPASSGLNEMVVTALGIKRPKGTLGYAISTVKGEELTKAGSTMNPFLALYGKAAGVGVNVGAAGPQGGIKINIRGAASMNPDQNTRPLFVVDGVILSDRKTAIGGSVGQGFDYGAGINDINPEDIESIDILKGAKATVLYGSDAANGVMLITTKNGRNAQGLGMTGSFQYAIEQPVSYLKLQNKYGLGDNLYDTVYATINGRKTRMLPNKRFSFGPAFDDADVMFYDSTMVKNSAHTGNFMSLFQTGHSTTGNVAISGSNEKGSLRASYTNYNYHDIAGDNAWQKRNTFSFSGNIKASKLATFEVISNIYNVTTQNRRDANGQSVAWGFPVDYDFSKIYPFYTDATGYKRDLSNAGVPTAFSNLGEFQWNQRNNRYKDDKLHMITSAKVTLNFTPNIFLVGQAGLDYDNTNYTTEKSVTRILPSVDGGSFGVAKENATTQTYQALLNYNKSFLHDDLHLFAFAGGVYRLRTVDYLGTNTIGGLNFANWYSFANESGTPNTSNAYLLRNYTRGNDVLYSMLASAALSWKNEITLELQGRQDWNSTLPPENNKYFYPGAALTWNYTERFRIPAVNTGQLRLSWADVGNGTNRYFANNQYGFNRLANTTALSIAPPAALLPGALKPERKREFEIGINNTFLPQNRITLDFSFYTNHRYNQIFSLPISPASSSTGLKINVGDVKAWGFELAVTGTPLLGKNYRWNLTLNAASQGSMVTRLYPGVTNNPVSNLINGSAASIHADEGRPYGEILLYDYLRDDAGNKVVDNNGLYALNNQKTISGGNVMPKIYGGFISDFQYGDFNFRIGLDYKYGGTIFSYTNNRLTGTGQLESTLDYRDEASGGLAYYIDGDGKKIPWQHNLAAPANASNGRVYHDGMILPGVKMGPDGKYVPNDRLTSATSYYQSYANDLATSFPPDRLFKNNYIKVREIALSYNLPAAWVRKMKLQRLTLTAAARNLFYIYKSIPNIDPEGALGADVYVENTIYPSQRTYSFGLNVAF
ncbi:SusC/RagA family TonB-linked outer membrane protein [Chitinophaga nivalis]|uniref:SusC/RagA family TonB-linked outer membrane protein n=1 Tax=Chitinophaga nivalis TaxID=2991709 RepID=A0ABT3IFG8_9BACT|nr:SusC/RagA family TonB-linked outer membrane protein [Chitinophaga nivalis]MCW3467610.1 SusC/RagA family TonB-linked outer membrane protein [Chitinophaga nivalis]MCW3482698.1 SusC/RagA family TonB-linked outer membrane protein [Chitinophaga nivalis]